MSERLDDATVKMWAEVDSRRPSSVLAREVQASRKLIADLRALHVAQRDPDQDDRAFCAACDHPAPCPTIELIDEAGL